MAERLDLREVIRYVGCNVYYALNVLKPKPQHFCIFECLEYHSPTERVDRLVGYVEDVLLLMLRALAPKGTKARPLEKSILEHVQKELSQDGGLQLEVGGRIADMQLVWRKNAGYHHCSCWRIVFLLYRCRTALDLLLRTLHRCV